MDIILKNTSAIATIATHGAELCSFQDGFGTEYMHDSDPKYWDRTAPILFPIVGNLRGDKTVINGEEYTIKKHGFARDMDFRCVLNTGEKAVFSLMSNADTKKVYPFDFNLQITYELKDCTLAVKYDVYNMGDVDLPFLIGAHPAFKLPLVEEDKFENYHFVFEKNETINAPVYDMEKLHWDVLNRLPILNDENTLALDYEMFKDDAILLDTLKSKSVELVSVLTGRGIKLSFDGFKMLGLWSPYGKKAPFVCIEPWCGTAMFSDEDNDFLHKRDVQIAQPDEKKTYIMEIQMI